MVCTRLKPRLTFLERIIKGPKSTTCPHYARELKKITRLVAALGTGHEFFPGVGR